MMVVFAAYRKTGPKSDDFDAPSASQEPHPYSGEALLAALDATVKDVCALVSSHFIDSRRGLDLCQANRKAA